MAGRRGVAGVQEGHDNDFAPVLENQLPAPAFPFAMTNENMVELPRAAYFLQRAETF
jgi:hypothetical protein